MNARSFHFITTCVSVFVSAGALQAGVSAEPRWASLGGGPQRTGSSTYAGPVAGGIKWTFETGGAVVGSVTVGSDGRIHVACEDGKLYTLDSGGKPLWVLDVNCPLLTAPTIGPDGGLYVGGRDGSLFAVDSGGRRRWTYRTAGAIYASPAVGSNSHVYIGSTDGTLYALDQNGTERWRFRTRGPGALPQGAVLAAPTLGRDGTIYAAGLYDPNLYALRSADGTVKWVCRFPPGANGSSIGGWPFTAPVVGPDGTIYQTLLYDRHLYAIHPDTGAIRWSLAFSDPALPDQSQATGLDGDGWSEPVLGPDGTIYVAFDDSLLHAVHPNGTVKWTKWLSDVGAFTLTVDRTGMVYAASDDGRVYAVDSGGWLITEFQVGGWPAFPVIAADGVLILVDSKDYSSLKTDARSAVWAISSDALTKLASERP